MASGKDIITHTLGTKSPKGTADRKKRKRPSKKVPTTVVEATCTDFMDLVLKLTGAEEERRGKSVSDPPPSTSPAPPPPTANVQQGNPRTSQTYFQDLLRSKTALGKVDLDEGSFSPRNNYTSAPNSNYAMRSLDHYDQQPETFGQYNSYRKFSPTNWRDAEEENLNWFGSRSESFKESSRAPPNEISSTSSQTKRDKAGPSSYWFSMDHMPQRRAWVDWMRKQNICIVHTHAGLVLYDYCIV